MRKKKNKSTGFLKLTVYITLSALGIMLVVAAGLFIYITSLFDELPQFEKLEKYNPISSLKSIRPTECL